MTYRHEYKHEINACDIVELRQRLTAVASPDKHAKNGVYTIRSLYFDTPQDTALREKIDGVNNREKFRIRCYNNDFSTINLEKKSKVNGLGQKQKAPLTPEQVSAIIHGDYGWMIDSPEPLIREFYCKILLQRLEPKTIVEYTREPFVLEAGNVRVTFDTNLRSGLRSIDFLNPDLVTMPINPGKAILEVKWDEYLPTSIVHAVGLHGRRTAPFSKYAACRMYD